MIRQLKNAGVALFGEVGNFYTAMAEITTKICAILLESFFKKAALFKDAHCDEMAQKCQEAFASYGLRPTQIFVKSGDQAFNYDVSFSLFNGNGTFKISAEKVDVHLQNATSDKDLEIVEDCIAKVYEHLPLPEINSTLITANAQTTMSSVEELQKYLQKFANPAKRIVSGGAIVNVLCEKWPQEMRVTVERSIVFPAGLFLTWSTTHPGNKLSRDVLKKMREALEESVTKLDLSFPKGNQQ